MYGFQQLRLPIVASMLTTIPTLCFNNFCNICSLSFILARKNLPTKKRCTSCSCFAQINKLCASSWRKTLPQIKQVFGDARLLISTGGHFFHLCVCVSELLIACIIRVCRMNTAGRLIVPMLYDSVGRSDAVNPWSTRLLIDDLTSYVSPLSSPKLGCLILPVYSVALRLRLFVWIMWLKSCVVILVTLLSGVWTSIISLLWSGVNQSVDIPRTRLFQQCFMDHLPSNVYFSTSLSVPKCLDRKKG